MPSSALTSCSSTRAPQSTSGTTPSPSHLPTPCNLSPPPILLPIADAEALTTGRERRVHKSVNYAEPKLNTKTHKPDPVTQVKRSSSPCGGVDLDTPMVKERRRKSCLRLPVDDDEESDGAQVDKEPLAGSRVRMGMANVDTRWRSAFSDRGRLA